MSFRYPPRQRTRQFTSAIPRSTECTLPPVVGRPSPRYDVNGKGVRLTGKELQVLELLWTYKGTTVTKEMFLNHLYGGMDEPELKIIDVFICRLRKKMQEATGGKPQIETVWGRGYRLRGAGEIGSADPERR